MEPTCRARGAPANLSTFVVVGVGCASEGTLAFTASEQDFKSTTMCPASWLELQVRPRRKKKGFAECLSHWRKDDSAYVYTYQVSEITWDGQQSGVAVW